MALEEAKLAKDGILESHLQAEEVTNVEAQPDRVEEVMISNIDQEYYCQDQVKLIFYICVFISWFDKSIYKLFLHKVFILVKQGLRDVYLFVYTF